MKNEIKPITPQQRKKIDALLLEEHKEEMQKCKDDPVYFYNKYVRREGDRELTKEEYDRLVERSRIAIMKLRHPSRNVFMFPKLDIESYEKDIK